MKKLGFLIILFVVTVAISKATTRTVTNSNDAGAGSLRNVVNSAISGDTIKFALTYPDTITLTSGDIDIQQNIYIIGPGAGNLAIDGNGASRIFDISSNCVISDLTIRNGSDVTGGAIDNSANLTMSGCYILESTASVRGGGIENTGSFTMTSCYFSGNTSLGQGGAIYSGVSNFTLTDCIFTLNKATDEGGGIYASSGLATLNNCSFTTNTSQLDGGGIYCYQILTMTNCSFLTNTSTGNGGGIYCNAFNLTGCTILSNSSSDKGGGIYVASASGQLTDCTISNNLSTNDGGGIYSNHPLTINNSSISGNLTSLGNGGGIYCSNSPITITNSTISGNDANLKGGGIYILDGNLTITNTTISGNSSDLGAAIHITCNNYHNLTLMNCTMADNTLGESGQGAGISVSNSAVFYSPYLVFTNCIFSNTGDNFVRSGTVNANSNGYNISSDSTMSSFLNNTNDLNNTDPLLGALANNGGNTKTHALLCGSPAINAGTTSFSAPANDQRGLARVNGTDIGAFEFQSSYNGPTTSSTSIVNCGDYVWNSKTYKTSGTYTDTIPNAAGCDSVMTLNLTIKNTASSQNVTACGSYVWMNNTYTTSGVYLDTIPNTAGCDSIMTLNLTINQIPVLTTSLNGVTITANETGATYQWINCAGNTAISGEANQSYTAAANGSYAVVITKNGCSDTSACVNITTVGISNISNITSQISVYPNPTKGIISINTTNNLPSYLRIKDILGKEILAQQITVTGNIDISKYESGIYFLVIETGDKQIVKKVIKQ